MYNQDVVGEKVFDIRERSFQFGVRIVKLASSLPNAGTKKEFVRCLTIALKEARETEYWLRLVVEVDLIKEGRLKDLLEENREIIKILITIVKNSKLKS